MSNPAFKLLQKRKKELKKKTGKLVKKGQKRPILFIIGLTFLVLFLSFLVYFLNDLPSPTSLSKADFPTSTQIFDRNAVLLYEIYTEQNRTPIKLEEVPEVVKQTTIAIEDKDFYKHRGLALRGITRASYNIIFKRKLEGGSTITQQLIKTTLLSPERTLKRKIREAILASLTEIIYTKDEILEMYLNHVPYGGTSYGIEQASKRYFGKSVKDVNLAEAALLAGLPAAPTRYSPFGAEPLLAKERQNQVLDRMVQDGYITRQQEDEAFSQTLKYAPQTTDIKAPHFVMYVKDLLVEKYGQKLVEQGGLRVTTSLDWQIQKYSEDVVATEIANLINMNVSNGATVITKPATGEILAMVGSKDYFSKDVDGNVNIATSLRQPGSSIKPLNYATGLINGYTPATLFLDIPTCFNAPGQPEIYCPHNYDNRFHGPVTMRSALANSYNMPAVKMLSLNGIKAMMATAKMMGISTWSEDSDRYGLSLTLGGGEVRMTEMAVAFGVFANLGKKVYLQPILKVEDYKGTLYEQFDKAKQEKSELISPNVCWLINDILADNNARTPMFGSHSQLNIPNHTVAVKTGTTDHPRGPRDNWTIGFTPSFLVATWVGNNDNSSMNPYLVSGVTGAAPLWNKIMTFILKDVSEETWEKPTDIVETAACTWEQLSKQNETQSASPASECQSRKELSMQAATKNQAKSWVEKKQIWIDKTTNMPPVAGKTDDLELREQLIGHDPFTKEYCLTCPHTDEKANVVNLNEDLSPTNIIPPPKK